MGSALEHLTDLVDAENPYQIPWAELLPKQIEAANERFTERIGAIRLLAQRADAGGIKAVREMADLVPLLFAHTSYKSYPESWFTNGEWERMGKWLDTLTSTRVQGVDLKGVEDVDDWIERLGSAGHYVSCSSGTTGRCSIIPANMEDRTFCKRNLPTSLTWATGIKPERQFRYFGLAPVARTFRANDGREAQVRAFAAVHRPFPGEPITVGRINKMVTLRRRIAEGTARPTEIADFEATSAQRAKDMEDALRGTAEEIVANRGDRILLQGLAATLYQITELVRGMGYGGKDFNRENVLSMSGGLKGANLPADFREQISATFNIAPERTYLMYSMQEINSCMPACRAGRYHVPPWVIFLLLDQTGDQLIAPEKGEREGRAAFFDLSLSGRWCGLISGDKVRVDYGQCACGHHGPTVAKEIVRYSEVADGDKITCAGTIEAYIRGAI